MRSVLSIALLLALLPGYASMSAQLISSPDPHDAPAPSKEPLQPVDTTLPPPCQAIDQSISVVPVFNPGEVHGQQLMMVQLYNSGSACSLSGMPALDFSANSSATPRRYNPRLIPVQVDDSLADPAPNAIPGTVILLHAELAQMRITWSSVSQPHTTCRNLDAIRIVLPNDAPLTEIIALHTHVCGALNVSNFLWGWVKQTNILRASWAPDAGPNDPVDFQSSPGSVYGDHFNGIGISLRTTTGDFPIGADVVLDAHVKNIKAPREPVVGDHSFRWLSMRESNGHTVLYSLGTAPPTEAGDGDPVPRGQGHQLPQLSLRELGMEPALIGHVTYALTAEFWPARTNSDGSLDPNGQAYAPTAVVSFRMPLNFTAPN